MKTRPKTLAESRERSQSMFSMESYKAGLALKLRPTDVVITPFGKSGTTWTQQIVHTLRTRGDMDFDDISRVVPWIEVSGALGLDLDAEQRANPRAFKSHLAWDDIPKGGRYINVVRNPADVIVSMFKFQEGWFLEPGAVELDEYAEESFLKSRAYYKHLKSWWAHRHDENVLFLCYEHMLADPEQTIRRIADFIGIELDDELLALTLEHSSLEFMLAHKDRFDDAMLRARSEELVDLPPGSDSAKVREGRSGTGQQLGRAVLDALDELWHEEIEKSLGFPTYEALTEALRRESEQSD